MKIIYKRLSDEERQVFAIYGNKLIASQMNASGRIKIKKEYSLGEQKSKSLLLFDKIVKHGVEMCMLCEIIQDNVLKR